ncbi:hypothetical protein AGLY_005466 [Aphis glycines]|uniref:Cation-transporting ATPase n=1 Tax=Aphis glycines TaxID=307491 RepID=A0A6G0TUH8_APHGL|nr:hypothetical protein AGLY_005466 [Aphis glycines]
MASNENCPTVDTGAVFKHNGFNTNSKKEPIISDNSLLNAGEDDEMEIYGYKRSGPMAVIIWILIFLTLGFLRLLFHWWPHWVMYAMYKRCPLNKAERVLIVESYEGMYKSYFVRPVKNVSIKKINKEELLMVNNISKSDSNGVEENPVELEIKSIRIHLNDGSYQGLFHFDIKKKK